VRDSFAAPAYVIRTKLFELMRSSKETDAQLVVALHLRVSVIVGLARSNAYKGEVLCRVSAFLLFVFGIFC
jgi:hypothetical protein